MRRGIPVKILKYITCEFARTVMLTLIIITAMWVFVTAMQVVKHQPIGPRQFLMAIPLLTVMSLPYTLPMAIMMGASVAYGRMSAENEVRAMEWNGIHVGWVMLPALALTLAICVGSFYVSVDAAPVSRVRLKRLGRENLFEIINRQLVKAAQTGRTSGEGNVTLALKSYDAATGTMHGVKIVHSDNDRVLRTVEAARATIVPGREPGAVRVPIDADKPEHERRYATFRFSGGKITEYDPETGAVVGESVAPPFAVELPADDDDLDPRGMPLGKLGQYAREAPRQAERWKARTLFYERIAVGMSPFFFALLAVPMSMQGKWKHMLTSLLPSLVIVVALYYPLIMWAKVQGQDGRLDPMYGMFLANAVMLAAGIVLIIRLFRR